MYEIFYKLAVTNMEKVRDLGLISYEFNVVKSISGNCPELDH
jgi:hypothetical protein